MFYIDGVQVYNFINSSLKKPLIICTFAPRFAEGVMLLLSAIYKTAN